MDWSQILFEIQCVTPQWDVTNGLVVPDWYNDHEDVSGRILVFGQNGLEENVGYIIGVEGIE